MKKIYILTILAFISINMHAQRCAPSIFDLVFTSGFIWKVDRVFKEVYGVGIPDLITVDGCYYLSDYFGIGIKTSYWERKGKEIIPDQPPKIQEVPLITYLRARVGYGIQGYISLGGGATFVKENRDPIHFKKAVGIGEVEAGINYYIHRFSYFSCAFRYLFPRQSFEETTLTDFGGLGLRVGLAFSY
jgi:hypothetical protein